MKKERQAKAATKLYTAYGSSAPPIGTAVHLVSESSSTPE
jgi:hypothetical protein